MGIRVGKRNPKKRVESVHPGAREALNLYARMVADQWLKADYARTKRRERKTKRKDIDAMNNVEKCHCGKPLHYNDPKVEKDVRALIKLLGENVEVHIGDRRWIVPRHYIALHGIKAGELPTLGFKEVTR